MSKEKPYSPLLEAKATLEVFRKKKKICQKMDEEKCSQGLETPISLKTIQQFFPKRKLNSHLPSYIDLENSTEKPTFLWDSPLTSTLSILQTHSVKRMAKIRRKEHFSRQFQVDHRWTDFMLILRTYFNVHQEIL